MANAIMASACLMPLKLIYAQGKEGLPGLRGLPGDKASKSTPIMSSYWNFLKMQNTKQEHVIGEQTLYKSELNKHETIFWFKRIYANSERCLCDLLQLITLLVCPKLLDQS